MNCHNFARFQVCVVVLTLCTASQGTQNLFNTVILYVNYVQRLSGTTNIKGTNSICCTIL